MAGQNFALEDRLDTDAFNAALWAGLAGRAPEASVRSGLNLSENREQLLKLHRDPATRTDSEAAGAGQVQARLMKPALLCFPGRGV
jgi:hypothetical protein